VALPYAQALARIASSSMCARPIPANTSRACARATTTWSISAGANPIRPGNEQLDFWGSKAADSPASENYAGIKDPAVDAIVDRILLSKDRDEQVAAIHALDRVMMAQQYVIPATRSSATASPTGTASDTRTTRP